MDRLALIPILAAGCVLACLHGALADDALPRTRQNSQLATANETNDSGFPALAPQSAKSRNSSTKTAKGRSTQSSWPMTLTGLAAVVGLILGGSALLRKHAPRAAGILPADVIQVLGRRYIDSRQSIQLIRCGSRILVLANSPQHGLQTLSEITDPVEVDTLAGQCRQHASVSATNNFAQILGMQERPTKTQRRPATAPVRESEPLREYAREGTHG